MSYAKKWPKFHCFLLISASHTWVSFFYSNDALLLTSVHSVYLVIHSLPEQEEHSLEAGAHEKRDLPSSSSSTVSTLGLK